MTHLHAALCAAWFAAASVDTIPTSAHALTEGQPRVVLQELEPMESSLRPVDADAWQLLESHKWSDHVGMGKGVWISVAQQRFRLVEDGAILWDVPCATAAAGVGSRGGSNQTPLGWHAIAEKIGEGAKWGQVFRSRQPSKEVWKPGMDTEEDLVLTRILWLDGLEPGVNKGRMADGTLVDSKQRYIYIHGTNGEEQIGQPSSHGCVRLLNDDVIKAFDMLHEGTKVLITEN